MGTRIRVISEGTVAIIHGSKNSSLKLISVREIEKRANERNRFRDHQD